MEFPRIRVELEGVRQNITHLFNENNDKLNEMVIEEINRQLTEDYIVSNIQRCVSDCIEKAVDDVANNYKLKTAITNIIAESIEKLISPKQEE